MREHWALGPDGTGVFDTGHWALGTGHWALGTGKIFLNPRGNCKTRSGERHRGEECHSETPKQAATKEELALGIEEPTIGVLIMRRTRLQLGPSSPYSAASGSVWISG